MGIFAYQHTMLKIKFQNPNGFLLLFFAIFFLARRSNSGPLNCLTPIKKESELWRIPETHRSYYEQISPDDKFSIFSSIFRDHSDPTYGRKQISKSPGEMQIKNDGFLKLDAKVYLDHKTNVLVNHKTKSWVRYQIWLDSKAAESQNNKMDFFFAHGMNSYGGIFSRFAKKFLDAGYRIIVPDLPSHGHSTGIHAHIPKINRLPEAIQVVLYDVFKRDREAGMEQRDVFVCGHSLGGFAAISYALKYFIPEISSFDIGIKDFKARVKGIIAVSPMIGVARESLPYYPTQCLIRALAKCFPTIKVSELPIPRRRHSIDPSIKKRFKSDPQTFHGTLRLSTAPALLDGVEFIRKEGSNLNIPFIIFHGNKDEVTDCSSSKKFYEEAKATNKEFKIYNNANHSLIILGSNEKIHETTEALFQEIIDWMKRLLESENSFKMQPTDKCLDYK